MRDKEACPEGSEHAVRWAIRSIRRSRRRTPARNFRRSHRRRTFRHHLQREKCMLVYHEISKRNTNSCRNNLKHQRFFDHFIVISINKL